MKFNFEAPTKPQDKDFDPENLASSNSRETRSKTKTQEISKTVLEPNDQNKKKNPHLKMTGKHLTNKQEQENKIEIEEPKHKNESIEVKPIKTRGRSLKNEEEQKIVESHSHTEIKEKRETRSKQHKLEESREKIVKGDSEDSKKIETEESDSKKKDKKPKKLIEKKLETVPPEEPKAKNPSKKYKIHDILNEKNTKKEKNFHQYAEAIEKLQEYALPDSIPCREEEKKNINDFLLEGLQSEGSNQTLCNKFDLY